jgi:choline dehydrogenase-like flavoprotein
MARATDAVIDPNLGVYGADGSRVPDAPIMTRLSSQTTNAALNMIGAMRQAR